MNDNIKKIVRIYKLFPSLEGRGLRGGCKRAIYNQTFTHPLPPPLKGGEQQVGQAPRLSIISLILLSIFLLTACTKSVNTASSDKFNAANPQADTLAIKKGLSIEDYLKEEQKKTAESANKVFTESLWNDSRSSGLLFVDHKARIVGDIITVDIIETSNATKKATTSTSRDSSIDAGIDSLLGLPTNFGMKDFLGSGQPFSPNVKSSYKNKFAGSGTTSRSGTITATISAEVTEVLPNGNLRIAGHSEIKVNNETQIITITGIIRLQDIDETNSVKSTALADARIEYYGDGVIGDKQKQGWLTKVFDYIWPF